MQAVSDLGGRPFNELRVLDLACLEGLYGIEMARHGADVVGVEIREAHLAKARFAADALQLSRYELRRDDVRNISAESYGLFDVVLCIGILYHLDAPDVFGFIERMSAVCKRLLVIDTHVTAWRGRTLVHAGRPYRGRRMFEHLPWSTKEQRIRKPWASIDNPSSVWLSRASLENALQETGFTSVYACDVPATPGRPEYRQTFVAVKGSPAKLLCVPDIREVPALLVEEKSPARTAVRQLRAGWNILRATLARVLRQRR
jgi:hypothetical protein